MTHSSIPTDTQPLEPPRARYEEREESEGRPLTRIAFGMLLANALLLVKDLLFGKTPKAAADDGAGDDAAPARLASDAVGLADQHEPASRLEGLDEPLGEAPLAFTVPQLGIGLGAATDAAAGGVSVARLTFHGSSALPAARAPSNDNEPSEPLSFRAPAADGGGGGGETAAPANPYLPGDGDDDDDDGGSNRAPVVTGRVALSDVLLSQSIVIASFELLRFSVDPDGDALSVSNLWASSGTITANAGGGWLYTPTQGMAGEVVITYTVSDGTHLVPQYALLDVVDPEAAAAATVSPAPAGGGSAGTARVTSLEPRPIAELAAPAATSEAARVITGTSGDDVIVGSDGDDVILAGAGDDVIDARRGDDTIDAGDGDDVVIAARDDGDDTIDGGDGRDTLDMSAITADAVVDLAAGTVHSAATGSDTLASIENVITGDGDDTVTGSDDANVIASGAGDDVVDGGAGCDSIDAGAGDDTIVIGASDAAVILTATDDMRDAALVVSDDIDDAAASDGDDVIDPAVTTAPAADAVASGDGDGDDVIDGGEGRDTLDMSAVGADIVVDLAAGTAVSDATGRDSLVSIENVVTGAGDDAVTGSDDANVIATGDGDDTIDGGAGCDTIDAGAGDDTIVVGASDAAVILTATDAMCDAVASDADGDGAAGALSNGNDDAAASDGEESGTGQPDVVTTDPAAACAAVASGDGDDVIDGGAGRDTLDMSAVDADIAVDLAAGTAHSEATGCDTLASIENVVTGAGDDAVTGSGESNRIATGGGADVIAAGAGSDTIDAGAGDDTIAAGAGDDTIDAGAGDDTIVAATGDGDDVIDGGDGRDTLDMSAIDADAVIDLSAGTAQSADTGSDTLLGIDNAIGGSGDDTLVAGDTVNDLFGGDGGDVFVFSTSLAAGNGAGSRDRIMDFDVGDRIDIEDISREFADQFEDALRDEGIRRFVLLRDSAEFSEPGQLRIQYEDLDDGTSVTIIEGNLDDDAETEFQIELSGHHDMGDEQFYHH